MQEFLIQITQAPEYQGMGILVYLRERLRYRATFVVPSVGVRQPMNTEDVRNQIPIPDELQHQAMAILVHLREHVLDRAAPAEQLPPTTTDRPAVEQLPDRPAVEQLRGRPILEGLRDRAAYVEGLLPRITGERPAVGQLGGRPSLEELRDIAAYVEEQLPRINRYRPALEQLRPPSAGSMRR